MDDDVHERRNNISEISSFGDFQINSPGSYKESEVMILWKM